MKALLVAALLAVAGTAWAGTCGTNAGRNSNTSTSGRTTTTTQSTGVNDNAGVKH